jgi:hypothetical protein
MAYIIGIVLVLGAVGMFIGAGAQKRKLTRIKATETSTAADLAALAASVGKEIGPGSFNQVAEVKGVIECGGPLVSELTQTACVYYSMSVTREYEETYWENDDKGNRVQRTRRGSEPVAGNTRSIGFLVRDKTGAIAVDPTGASFVSEKALSRFEQGTVDGGLKLGRFTFDLARLAIGGGRRTIGFRYEESVIPVGRDVYVLGEAVDSGDRLRIGKPAQKGAGFIVSLKSEEELVKGAEAVSTGLTIGSAVAAVGGIACVVLGILRVF